MLSLVAIAFTAIVLIKFTFFLIKGMNEDDNEIRLYSRKLFCLLIAAACNLFIVEFDFPTIMKRIFTYLLIVLYIYLQDENSKFV